MSKAQLYFLSDQYYVDFPVGMKGHKLKHSIRNRLQDYREEQKESGNRKKCR